MNQGRILSRRQFLKSAGGLAAAGALAACAAPAPTPQTTAEEAAPTAAPSGPLKGEIVFWMTNALDMGQTLQDEYNKLDTGITAKWELGDFDTNTKIMAALAAGNPPDLHHLGRWQTGDMAVRNAIVPLDDYIKASPTFKWENLWGRLQEDCTMWGKKWTVPLSTDTRAFFYNKKLLAEAGLDPENPPDTWEQLQDAAVKLTKKDDGGRLNQIGFTPSFANPPVYLMFCSVLWCKGGDIVDPELTKITIASQAGIDAMTFLKQLMDAQGGYEEAVAFTTGVTPGEGLDPFTMGAVATMMNGSWVFTTYDKVAADMDYGIKPGPKFEGSDIRCNYDGGGSWYIFREGEKQDLAWKFIEGVMEDKFLVPYLDGLNSLPPTKTASAEWEKKDERRPVFASTADTVKWIPVFSGTLETLGAMSTMFDNVLIAGNDIESELQAAQDKMQVILDRHNSFPPPA
jgi:ABC-type glycerol-3-phosphate transport system substrate-binding protein